MFVFFIGYDSSLTLYAEAESKLFLANDSDSFTGSYLYIEEVKIFLNKNSLKHYFRLEEVTGVLETTTNRSEAGYFTLKTTPELHELGQFQLVFSSNEVHENRTLANQIQDKLIMKLDFNSEYLTEDGPFKLFTSSGEYNDARELQIDIHGKSTTLPELQME